MRHTSLALAVAYVAPRDSYYYRGRYECNLSERRGGSGEYVKPVRGYVDALPSQVSNRRHLPTFLEQQKRRDAVIEERGGAGTPGAEAAAIAAVPSFANNVTRQEKAATFRRALCVGGESFVKGMGAGGLTTEEVAEVYHHFLRESYGVELDAEHHLRQAGASGATLYSECPSLSNSGTLGPRAAINDRDASTNTISPSDVDAAAVRAQQEYNFDGMTEELLLRDEDVSQVGLMR